MEKKFTGSRRAVKTTIVAPPDLEQLDLFASPLPEQHVEQPFAAAAERSGQPLRVANTPAAVEG